MQLVKKHLPLIVAIVFAITAGLLAYVSLQAATPSESVVVAKEDLPIGSVITAENVEKRMLPPSAIPPMSYVAPEQIIGKTVAGAPILKGDIVGTNHIAEEGSLIVALESYAPPGWVAVELPEGTGMGLGGITRGDVVDIYSLVPSGSGDQTISVTNVVLEGAVVLATPWTTIADVDRAVSYVVAVPAEHARVMAELIVQNLPVALVLKKGEQ